MTAKGNFSAGLIPWLVERLAKEGISVELRDQRPEPLPVDNKLAFLHNNVKLRTYQHTAIEAATAYGGGTIWLPTGSGKTEVMIEIARRIGCPGLILVHRKDLLHQTVARFAENLGNQEIVGIIGDGHWKPSVLTVATFQTLYNRLKERDTRVRTWLRERIGQVHVDECQHLPSRTYDKVMSQLRSARWRFGYSATPDKGGDLETFFRVTAHLGPTVCQIAAEELADEGYLVPVDVFIIRVPPPLDKYKDWQKAVKYGIVENAGRNHMIVELAKHLDQTGSGPVVILVERIAHGESLAKALGTQFLAGDAPTSQRQAAWAGLKDGSLNVVVVSKIGEEGLDIPPLAYLIITGGGKAPHLTIQKVGRGMRTSEGKDRLFVFDFLDQGRYLSAHAKRRLKTYKEQPAYSCSTVDFMEVVPQ
ncbi:hypothetical protein LCGC14_0532540 [marine sediment metagenome]|uniref:Helicase ATP-binding domain-containing protein n=1 Tax=marine sediment metagenome TaxID=412755 RepID=A0A0F9RVD2_9ZZZZ